MIYRIVLTPDAFRNLDQALLFYKNKASLKIAKSYLADYKKTIAVILRTKYFQIFFDNIR
jgi:hypothetical protein